MKKIILSVFLLVSGYSLFAQNNSNAPDKIRVSFENTYQGGTNVTWEPVTLPVFSQYSRADFANVKWEPAMEGWRASYIVNNRQIHVYYTDRGKSYTIAGPVMENKVPEDVVAKAISQYGNNIYDITMMKSAMNTDVYHIRFKENGNNMTSAWINADGSAASDIYVIR
jgi:hypothetical protein